MKNKEYLDAFEYFIDKMLAIPDTINIDVSDQLSRICDVLRISRMTVTIYDNYRLSDPDHRRTVVIYDKPPCDESCCIVRRNVTAAENAAVYSAWQRAGEDEWDEDEISSITRVLDLMFLFNGRSKLIKDAEKLIFFDHDMDIRNHKFYMRFIGQLCAQNKIGDYAAIFANLRRFSVINQQIGRENGNKVMQIFINKLKELMSDEELIARIGGDNFALIVRKGNLKRILNILEGTAITIDETYGERIMLSATAGVYVVPDNDSSISPSIIMDRISLASHIARASGKTDPVFFNQEIMNASQRVTSITADFPAAIAKKEFQEPCEESSSMDTSRSSMSSLSIASKGTSIPERNLGERKKDDNIFPTRPDEHEKNFDFGKNRDEEIAHFRRVYMTTVRNPRIPLELYIQIRTNADLNDYVVGSDSTRYKDVIFCHETKKAFRMKSGNLAGKVIPVFARKERQSIVDAIKGDVNLQNTINPDNLPFAVMSDSYFVAKDESGRYHDEERVLFVLTFPDEETEKAFKEIFKDKKSYVKGRWVSRPNYNWKKNFFLFVRWDSEYDGFIDSDGYRRKVVKGQCISIEKQLKKVENDLFSELEGEFIK